MIKYDLSTINELHGKMRYISLIAILMISACATVSEQSLVVKLIESEIELPTNCRQNISIKSGSAFEEYALTKEHATNDARIKAAKAGSTHILITSIKSHVAHFLTVVEAKGYVCRDE